MAGSTGLALMLPPRPIFRSFDAFRRSPCHSAAPSRHRRASRAHAVSAIARSARQRARQSERERHSGYQHRERGLFAAERAGRAYPRRRAGQNRGGNRQAHPQSRARQMVRAGRAWDSLHRACPLRSQRAGMGEPHSRASDPRPRVPEASRRSSRWCSRGSGSPRSERSRPARA